jgi:hypothetical protein
MTKAKKKERSNQHFLRQGTTTGCENERLLQSYIQPKRSLERKRYVGGKSGKERERERKEREAEREGKHSPLF